MAAFEENQGQLPQEILYGWLDRHMAVGAVPGGLIVATQFADKAHVMRLGFGNANSVPAPADVLTGVAHHFLGGGVEAEVANLPRYASLRFTDAWPGVDAVYTLETDRMKSTLYVAAGADVSHLDLLVEGANRLAIAPDGSLEIDDSFGTWSDSAPVAWQETGEGRVPVDVSFALPAPNTVRFVVGPHDDSLAVEIDPTLLYATLLGGEGPDSLRAVATMRGRILDPQRTFVVVGSTTNPLLLDVGGPYGPVESHLYLSNGLIAEFTYPPVLEAAGLPPRVEWVSVVHAGMRPVDVALASSGNVVLVGDIASGGIPLTPSPGVFQPGFAGGTYDGFILRVDPTGTYVMTSVFLGGMSEDRVAGMALASDESVYVVGHTWSTNFPVTMDAYQPVKLDESPDFTDGFVSHVSADGISLIYSTYWGGSGYDYVTSVDQDDDESVYICGTTTSKALQIPTTAGAHDRMLDGIRDGFVTKFTPTWGLAYSTLLGGSDLDSCTDIRVAPPETLSDSTTVPATAYVIGHTASADFPTTPGAYDRTWSADSTPFSAPHEGFVTRLGADGKELMYSSFLGGLNGDAAAHLEVDGDQVMYITGVSNSPDWTRAGSLEAGWYLLKLHWRDASPRDFKFLGQGSSSTVNIQVAPDIAVFHTDLVVLAGNTFGEDLPLLEGSPIPPRNPVQQGADGFVVLLETR